MKTLGVFPNSTLVHLDEKEFTGPFVASVILTHIDFYSRIHSTEQYKMNTINSSIAFEFHGDTFEQLFSIIDRLTTSPPAISNKIVEVILTVCLRLFTMHLRFLCSAAPTVHRDLLSVSDEWKKVVDNSSTKSDSTVDLSKFPTDHQFNQWFNVLLKLIQQNSKQQILCQEASKALICIMNKIASSFTEKLSFYHKTITENPCPQLLEQVLEELKKNTTLLSWIELLLNDNVNQSDKAIASTLLYSLIDMCFKSSNGTEIKQILFLFHEFLFIRLISPTRFETALKKESKTYSVSRSSILFVTDYLTHLLHTCADNELLNSIFVGLFLMIRTEDIFGFSTIQPICVAVLPILAEYLLKTAANHDDEKNNLHSICWLIGKMTNAMIVGSDRNSFEIKHQNKLKSSLFDSGCEQTMIENSSYLHDLYKSNLAVYTKFNVKNEIPESMLPWDQDFLMSIYNNTDEGAQLI